MHRLTNRIVNNQKTITMHIVKLPKISSLYNTDATTHLGSLNLSLYLVAYSKLLTGMISVCQYRTLSSCFKTCFSSSTPNLSSFCIVNDGAKHSMMSHFSLEIFQNSWQPWQHFPNHVALLVLPIVHQSRLQLFSMIPCFGGQC